MGGEAKEGWKVGNEGERRGGWKRREERGGGGEFFIEEEIVKKNITNKISRKR